jgi:hypothetical protein
MPLQDGDERRLKEPGQSRMHLAEKESVDDVRTV